VDSEATPNGTSDEAMDESAVIAKDDLAGPILDERHRSSFSEDNNALKQIVRSRT